MISELFLFAAFATIGILTIFLSAVLITLFLQGPAAINDLRSRGFSVRAWLSGDLPEQDDSTSIHVIEGVEIELDGRHVHKARQTRTISAEV